MDAIDGPSLGDVTKPMASDIDYMEGRRIVQRLADLEIPSSPPSTGPSARAENGRGARALPPADGESAAGLPEFVRQRPVADGGAA